MQQGRVGWRVAVWSTVTALALLAVATACVDTSGRSDPNRSMSASAVRGGVYCDGTDRPAGILSGAWPGETIRFDSPMPVEIPDASADDGGGLRFLWRCEPDEAGLTWEVTATGADSERTVTFRFSGTDVDPDLARILVFDTVDGEPVCDGRRRVIGHLTNALPDEPVDFSTDHTGRISPGRADPRGSLDVHWTCAIADVGRTRTVRAEGSESGRSVEFTVVGLAPRPARNGGIEVQPIESPFLCDRGRRPVATLTNLTPGITVDFEVTPSSPTEDGSDEARLRPGTADPDGSLDVHWQCHRDQVGIDWTLTVTERPVGSPTAGETVTVERRTVEFSFSGKAPPTTTSASVVEDPFICDGRRREVAELTGFTPNEFVDFTSPQTEDLRQGQADEVGRLTARWQCGSDDVGRVWVVTATGATSRASQTFTITAGAP